ncbi:hypothetical protein NAV26_21380, partial [Pseudomonas stutzeri]
FSLQSFCGTMLFAGDADDLSGIDDRTMASLPCFIHTFVRSTRAAACKRIRPNRLNDVSPYPEGNPYLHPQAVMKC